MPTKLPSGWVKTTLGEVCAINPHKRATASLPDDIEVSFVPMAAVEEGSGRLDASDTRPLGAVRRGYTPFEENDVIFAKITPCMENGKIAMATGLKNGLAYGSTEFVVFRPYEGVLPRFLLHFLLQPSFRQAAEHQMSGASGQKRVPVKYLLEHEFLLPPTNEQERIVAKLDAALAAIERAEVAARRAQERIIRYRAAIVDSAACGELSRAWRANKTGASVISNAAEVFRQRLLADRRSRWEQEELRRMKAAGRSPKDDKWKSRYHEPALPRIEGLPEKPAQWAWISVSQISWNAGYGTSVKCTYDGKGPAVLRIPNIRDRSFNLSDLKFATLIENFEDQDFVEPGDLLLIRTNGTKELIGRAAILRSPLPQKCSFASYLIRLRLVGDQSLWSWLSLVWDSNIVRTGIESRAATTAGQYNVSLSGLADLAIPLPPTEEQMEVIAESERRMSAASQLQATLQHQLTRALAARETLLHDAFSGDLVAQNSEDETASLLLERIKARRENRALSQKGKRMSTPKIKVIQRPLLNVLHERKMAMTPEELFRDSGYQQEFNDNECRQEIVDRFYEELRQLTGPNGTVIERRPDRNTVLLEIKS